LQLYVGPAIGNPKAKMASPVLQTQREAL
jgi:hypothetical protein